MNARIDYSKMTKTKLNRAITQEEIETYQRDGVVCLRQVLSAETVDALREVIDSTVSNLKQDKRVALSAWEINAYKVFEKISQLNLPSVVKDSAAKLQKYALSKRNKSLGIDAMDMKSLAKAVAEDKRLTSGEENDKKFFVITDSRRSNPKLNDICLNSELPEIAAEIMQSKKTNFYLEQLFFKDVGAAQRTAFHQDKPYFEIEGEQCLTIWCATDIVTRENGAMGYVVGSHKWGKLYKPNNFVSQNSLPGAEGEDMPDIEGNEEKYNVVYFDVEPGDVIIHHYATLHGATGNTSATRMRRAGAFRYCGDDATFIRRKTAPPKAFQTNVLKVGDPLDSEDFPVVRRC